MNSDPDRYGPPTEDFSDSVADRLSEAPTDERVHRVALGLTEPTGVSEVAERADCSPNAARRHLARLADIGVLERVTSDPDTFERNESYFEWRRLNRLASLPEGERDRRLRELLSEDAAYRDRYDAERPSAVDPLSIAADDDHGDAEQVWLDCRNWEAIREEISDLRRVRRSDSIVDEAV
ncbi:DUF7342 family protein [Halopenitus persicus]|uniref:Uncharacterized protein n=1 Tax=Halopenitus persicus TaxID=1048396 RepID=A0A1H3MP20_9EURY|nr:transcriptional regulator [Halopenitus persicus]SDY78214.1 hypothetical protein SAMN05216564_11021 [Halopenitus persicus]